MSQLVYWVMLFARKVPGKHADRTLTALQGAFAEHQATVQKLSLRNKPTVLLVRTVEELKRCDGLIIPGGGKPSNSLKFLIEADHRHPPR